MGFLNHQQYVSFREGNPYDGDPSFSGGRSSPNNFRNCHRKLQKDGRSWMWRPVTPPCMHVNRWVPGCGFKPRHVVVGWKPGFYWGGIPKYGKSDIFEDFSYVWILFLWGAWTSMILMSPEPQHAVNFLCKEHRLKSQFLLEEFCLRKKKCPDWTIRI